MNRNCVVTRGRDRNPLVVPGLAMFRALPGIWTLLTALAGNSGGELALIGGNSMAVPKSMVCRRSTS
jgi:hypothetical protein